MLCGRKNQEWKGVNKIFISTHKINDDFIQTPHLDCHVRSLSGFGNSLSNYLEGIRIPMVKFKKRYNCMYSKVNGVLQLAIIKVLREEYYDG